MTGKKIRLAPSEVEIIKKAILALDPNASVFLFGSRANPDKRGGDIDILVFSEKLNILDKIAILTQIFKDMEEQKIDIVIAKNDSDPFVKLVMKEAVPL